MTDPLARLRRFLRELKRRKVYRVAVVYAGVAFVTLQAARLVFPTLAIPGWVFDTLVVLALFGFPIALVLAWAFEVTPEGVQRTSAEEGEVESPSGRAQSRLAMKALVGLGLVGAAVAGGWYLMGGGGESPEIGERTVAVLPFQVSGSGADTWRDGMVTMLSTGLDGAAGLRAIADQTVFATWEQVGRDGGSPARDRSLTTARQVGAEYAVVGQAVQLGEELRLAADIHDTQSGDRVGQAEVQGSPDQVTALTDSLTRRILGVLLEESGEGLPSVNLGGLTTSSLPALKSYLRGERHFRAGDFEAAIDEYEAAVGEDSTFALAHARLATSLGWQVEPSERFWERAYRFSDRLPERERRLVRGQYLWSVQNRALAAADTLRRLTEDYPDDPRIWSALGETIFHNSIPRGWPEADTAFGRAVELDPGMAPYHNHYADLAFSVHRDSALAAERILAHPGAGFYKQSLRYSLDLVFGSSQRREEILSGPDSVLGPFDSVLGPFALQHPADRQLWIEVARRDLTPAEGLLRSSLWNFAGAKLSAGQVQGVLRIAQAESWSPEDLSCLLAYARSLAMPVPDSLARRYLTPDRVPVDASIERLWCVGLSLIDRGRGEELPEWLRRIRSAADLQDDPRWPGRTSSAIAEELQGYQAFRAGDLTRAEGLWSRRNPSGQWGAVWRGDLYRELGDLQKAEGWYLAAWRHPLAHERLGQVYEQMDRPGKAVAAYRRFIAAWEDADPELQDRVEEARKRLQALNRSAPETDD